MWCACMVCIKRDVGYFMMLSSLVNLYLFMLLLSWMDGLLGWYIDGLHDSVKSLAFAHVLQHDFNAVSGANWSKQDLVFKPLVLHHPSLDGEV